MTSATEGTEVVRRAPFGSNPFVGERGTDTHRRILAAALEVFAEAGFGGARVELITERAGCSRPAFYQYFENKDDVFWALAGQLGREMVTLASGLGRIGPDAGGLDRLRRWLSDFFDLHEDYAPIFAGFQAASRERQATARSSSGIADRTGEALLRAFGRRPTARNQTVVNSLVAVTSRCANFAEAMPVTVQREPLVDALAQLIHRLLARPVEGVNVVATAARRRPPAPVTAPSPTAGDGRLRPRGEQTRQRLFDAGAAVLPARGYHDTRVDDIARAAGVSHGTFYRYFENKDDFFRVLAEAASARMVELLDELRIDADAGELSRWLREWLDTYRDNGGVISTWQEMEINDDLAAFSRQAAEAVVSRLVRKLEHRGFGDPEVDAVIFLAVLERVPHGVHTLGFTAPADAVEAMATIIRRGFLAGGQKGRVAGPTRGPGENVTGIRTTPLSSGLPS